VLDLQTVLAQGTELYYGEYRVIRIAMYSGHDRLIADVPVTAGKRELEDWAENPCGKAILAALKHGPMTTKEVMEKCGYRGGWFRRVLTGLQLSGRVIKVGPKYQLSQ